MYFSWLRNLFNRRSSRLTNRRRLQNAHAVQVELLEQRKVLTMLAPVNYASVVVPTAVAAGDFNNDGVKDIVEQNSSAGTISVLLGNGDGTFQAPINSVGTGYGSRIVVGDFNRDGNLDVVVSQGATLGVYQGNGNGTFQAPYYVLAGGTVEDFRNDDLNHDGFDDLIISTPAYGGTTQVFLNNTTGGFGPPINLGIGPYVRDIEIGDINGDGNDDLVETGMGYNVEVFLGRGNGTFLSASYPYIGTATQMIAVGDLNHDGLADLAVDNGTTLTVMTGTTSGTFTSPTTYSLPIPYSYATTSGLRIADINADGNNDIVSDAGLVGLGRGDGSLYTPTAYGTPTSSATAVADFNADGALDMVSANPLMVTGSGGGVNVTLNGNNDAQQLAGVTQLAVSTSGPVTAGVPFAVTVTALDANGNVVPGFQGFVAISGAPGTSPVTYQFTANDAGVHTIPNAATLFSAGSGTYSVTSPFLPDASGSVNVLGAAAAKFSVVAQSASVAGDIASVTVSALDAYGNPTDGYFGTVHFSSSDIQAGLPANYTFTTADAGVHTFNVTLKTVGGQTVTATDTTTSTVAGISSAVTVTPAAAASLSVSGGGGYIGSVNAVQITARDAYGNIATSENGVVHLASSDASSVTSTDAALTNGVGVFTVTPMTLGSQTLTASEVANGAITGSEAINVTPGWGTRIVATPLAATVAGQTQTTTVTIYDAFGDVSTVFTGWVLVSTTDVRTGSSLVYFSANDAGVKTIPLTLQTAGTQAVTISDYYNPRVTVTQTGIVVTPAAATSLSVTPLIGTVAGVSQNYTVTAHDAYGNVATGYHGTVNVSSSDALATLPATYTFTAGDAGTHTFSMAFKSSGGQSITIADAVNPLAMTYFQRDLMITPGALSGFGFKGASLSTTTAGAVFSLTVSATDPYGNPITAYTGTALFTSSDAQITLPSSYTFTGADSGSHTFSVALKTAGTQSISVTDSANSAITSSLTSIVVKAAAASTVSITTSTTATSGTAQSLTVTVTDAYGNVSAGYTGTVKLSSSDALAILPASYTFTNKDAGVHTFSITLKSSGNQSVTVADTVNAALSATQSGIAVTASTAQIASFSVTGFPATTAGTTKSFTVTAKDAQGNIVSGYVGTVVFSSSDVKAGLPASYTFTAADAGVHTFSATLKTAGTQSISVSDSSANTVAGTEGGIVVTAAAAAQFVISGPTSVTQGVGFKFTMTVLDAYGNVATGYLGKVHLSSSDPKGGTSDYTFSSSDKGVHIFSYTLNTLGSQTLTVTDTTNSNLTVKFGINVLTK